jgi:voltage-gated potassium channel
MPTQSYMGFRLRLRRYRRRPSSSGKVFIVLPLLPVAVVLIGTLGFVLIEGFSWLDALYMTVITLTTVGFQEVHPLSSGGRLFTIILITVGVGAFLYALGQISEFVIDNAIFGRRLMDKRIQKLKDHYILCGFGRVGQVIARELRERNAPFVAVEENEEVLARLEAEGHLYVEGNATDDDVLEQAGVNRAKGLVAVLSNDADNVYVTLTARQANPGLVIVARSEAENSGLKLRRAGADKVINPYETSGQRMAGVLISPSVHAFVDTLLSDPSVDIQIGELVVDEGASLCNVKLRDSNIHREHDIIVVAIRRRDGEMQFNPGSETTINPGDTLIALGARESLRRLQDICSAAV